MLTAAAMASPDRSMAPSSDSSASRLWGGMRPALRGRRRASSIDWTMGPLTLPDHAVDLRRDTATFSGEELGTAVHNRTRVRLWHVAALHTRTTRPQPQIGRASCK